MEVNSSDQMMKENEDPWGFLEKELQEFEKAMKALEEVVDSDSTVTNSPQRTEIDSNNSSASDISSSMETTQQINEEIKQQNNKEKPQPPPKPKMVLTQDGRLKPVPPPRPTKALQ